MRRFLALLPALWLLAVPATSLGHSERESFYPNFNRDTKTFGPATGSVPKYRTTGSSLVVCKSDSEDRIRRHLSGTLERKNLSLLERCRFHDIQAAVNAAKNGYRILVLPGIYREEPSREVPADDPKCKDDYTKSEGADVPTYEYHRKCPNSKNLIAIVGDDGDADRRCDDKCNIQLEGTGRFAAQVVIRGAGFGETHGSKLNLIRADRADGVYLRNFEIEYSDFNNIYALETNGFVFDKIISRYSREYGFLSFTSDHGLYNNVATYGDGDSGVYPGSGPEGHCKRYGIEIRNANSFHNTVGYSGTAGNGIWAHHNRFHHNAVGMFTDSSLPGHPGMPEDCVKWENNRIYSNNLNLYSDERDSYCKNTPPEKRDPKTVCPSFGFPMGIGIGIAGGNDNIIRNNRIWDNWRYGTYQFWVPSALRGEDPTGQSDEGTTNPYETSHRNRYIGNLMGVRPDGKADRNGVDFWWDEEGGGNCWSGNSGPGDGDAVSAPTSDPGPPLRSLPGCPEGSVFSPGNPGKGAMIAPCATWSEQDRDPPGCDWFTLPPEPK
jgi:hypothetical protein